jgi:hypothetical protein
MVGCSFSQNQFKNDEKYKRRRRRKTIACLD